MKRDALRGFVFYTQDYFGDVLVRLMPGHLRIVWVEAFLLMDQSPRRGVLLKKNGSPYSVTELATAMSVPVEDVQAAYEWVIREGIAGVDPTSKALMCRRMVRERRRSEINTRNGRKGGNPKLRNDNGIASEIDRNLIGISSEIENGEVYTIEIGNDLDDSVNRNYNRADKAKPDPDPDPFSNTQHSSSIPVDLGKGDRGKPTARKTRAPAELPITDAMRGWAAENHITANLEAETAAMLDHHRGKGNLHSDWVATWRTWMRNTKRFSHYNKQLERGSNGTGSRHSEKDSRTAARTSRPYTPKQ